MDVEYLRGLESRYKRMRNQRTQTTWLHKGEPDIDRWPLDEAIVAYYKNENVLWGKAHNAARITLECAYCGYEKDFRYASRRRLGEGDAVVRNLEQECPKCRERYDRIVSSLSASVKFKALTPGSFHLRQRVSFEQFDAVRTALKTNLPVDKAVTISIPLSRIDDVVPLVESKDVIPVAVVHNGDELDVVVRTKRYVLEENDDAGYTLARSLAWDFLGDYYAENVGVDEFKVSDDYKRQLDELLPDVSFIEWAYVASWATKKAITAIEEGRSPVEEFKKVFRYTLGQIRQNLWRVSETAWTKAVKEMPDDIFDLLVANSLDEKDVDLDTKFRDMLTPTPVAVTSIEDE